MATSDKFPERAVKTLIGDLNDAEDRLPGTYPVYPITSLNHLYNVYPGESSIITDAPGIMYFGIGTNGFYNVDDKTGCEPYVPKKHENNLYEPLPFRVVPIESDLSDAERLKYRMRVEITINGIHYWAYYLKLLEIVDVSSKISRIDPVTGVATPYEFSSEYLTPTPTKTSTSGTSDGSITEVVVTKQVRAEVLGSEVYEAVNILYDGDLTRAKISEWGIFSGVDKVMQGVGYDGIAVPYTEAIYAQMGYKLCNTGTGIHSASQTHGRIFTFGNGKLIHQDL